MTEYHIAIAPKNEKKLKVLIKYGCEQHDRHTTKARLNQSVNKQKPSKPNHLSFSMPNWNPGSYKIRNFSCKIIKMEAVDSKGLNLKIEEVSLSSWVIKNAPPVVYLSYEVLANDTSYRGIVIEKNHAMLELSALCMQFTGIGTQKSSLHFKKPTSTGSSIALATALPALSPPLALKKSGGFGDYQAENYYHLIDNPIFLGKLKSIKCIVYNRPHYIYTNDTKALKAIDLQKFQNCLKQVNALFGSAPFRKYSFLVAVNKQISGGLEHSSCSNIQLSTKVLNKKVGIVSLLVHEYFHAWLVKYIGNQKTRRPNLQKPVYTNNLWFFEGITHYYDILILARAKAITKTRFLNILFKRISRHWRAGAWKYQSLRQASRQAWIRYYSPHSLSKQYDNCYYGGGMLAALLLDGYLRKQNRMSEYTSEGIIGIDSLLFHLYNTKTRIIAEDGIDKIVGTLYGPKAQEILNTIINQTTYPTLNSFLSGIGLTTRLEANKIDYQISNTTRLDQWLTGLNRSVA